MQTAFSMCSCAIECACVCRTLLSRLCVQDFAKRPVIMLWLGLPVLGQGAAVGSMCDCKRRSLIFDSLQRPISFA